MTSPTSHLIWLHLSDLHLCHERTGWDSHRVLEPMLKDLKTMERDHGLTPDLIFFTGDLAFGNIGAKPGSTLKDQFDDAGKLLEKVRTAFKTEIPKTNLFLVPGNHDVDRNEVTAMEKEWLASDQRIVAEITKLIKDAGNDWKKYMARLAGYAKFLKTYGLEHLLPDKRRLTYTHTRNIKGLNLGIAGMNTAWGCCKNNENGRLWMGGDWQIGELTRQLTAQGNHHLRIALTHHPMNWLVEQEGPETNRSIQREFLIHLHGHEHHGWVEDTNGHFKIAAGACYDCSWMENGYNFFRLNSATGDAEVWLRKYDKDGGGWIPRIIANKTTNEGMWSLKCKRLLVTPAAPIIVDSDPDAEPGAQESGTNHLSGIERAVPPVVERIMTLETASQVVTIDNLHKFPRVFISYSWCPDDQKEKVYKLAVKLRKNAIDAWIDQFDSHQPKPWFDWMIEQIEQADKVLMVFTPEYKERFEGRLPPEGSGKGARFEGISITTTIYGTGGHNPKFRAVLLGNTENTCIPEWIRNSYTTYYPDRDQDFGGLLRWLNDLPDRVPPPISETDKRNTVGVPDFSIPSQLPPKEELVLSEIYADAIKSMRGLYSASDFPRLEFPSLSRFVTESSVGYEMAPAVCGHSIEISTICTPLLAELQAHLSQQRKFTKEQLEKLLLLVGGFAVLAVNPQWVIKARENIDKAGIVCSVADASGLFKSDSDYNTKCANFLVLATAAIMNECCKLNLVFEMAVGNVSDELMDKILAGELASDQAGNGILRVSAQRLPGLTRDDKKNAIRRILLVGFIGIKAPGREGVDAAALNRPDYVNAMFEQKVLPLLKRARGKWREPRSIVLDEDNPIRHELVGIMKGDGDGLNLSDLLIVLPESGGEGLMQAASDSLADLESVFLAIQQLLNIRQS